MFVYNFLKFFVVMIVAIALVFAQDQQDGAVQNDDVGNQQGQELPEATTQEEQVDDSIRVDNEGEVKISNVLINNFENAERWYGAMSIDYGLIQVEKRKGGVKELRDNNPSDSKYVLGAKVNFFKAGVSDASIEPPAPVNIPGYTKKISVWVYGKGYRHKLSAIVRDFKGRTYKFSFGELSFYGWKKLETDIPSDPSWPFFSQEDVNRRTFFQTHGVTFLGFLIDFHPKESLRSFYVYLDNLSAESNIHLYEKELEIAKIPDDERLDPIDNW